MSKNTEVKMKRHWKRRNPPKFSIGDTIRIKPGTAVPDYPDVALAGWVGAIIDVDPEQRPCRYHIEWTKETLAALPASYRQRCQRNQIAVETIWLAEPNLQLLGDSIIEHEEPPPIVERSLSASDCDDRIRAVFGLTSADPLPDISRANLVRYRDYLAKCLVFPLQAAFVGVNHDTGAIAAAQVTVLAFAEEMDATGILCTVSMEDRKVLVPLSGLHLANRLPRKLVDDYRYWMETAEGDDIDFSVPAFESKASWRETLFCFVGLTLVVMAAGGVLGTVIGAMEYARYSAAVVAFLVGALLFAMSLRYAKQVAKSNNIPVRLRDLPGNTMLGALIGGFVGALLIAIVGALAGAAMGFVIGRYVFKGFKPGILPLFGAVVGGVVQAFWWDAGNALVGALFGLAVGLIGGIILAVCAAPSGERPSAPGDAK